MKNFVLKKGEALLVTDRLTRKYFSGVDVAEGVIVIADSVVAFSDARYFYAAKETFGKASKAKCKYISSFFSAHREHFESCERVLHFRGNLIALCALAAISCGNNDKKALFELIFFVMLDRAICFSDYPFCAISLMCLAVFFRNGFDNLLCGDLGGIVRYDER